MTFSIDILVDVAQNVLTWLAGNAKDNRESTIEAHRAMNSAFIKTYDYLRNRNGEYKTNLDLAEAWNEAAAAVMKVDQSWGEMLYHKSRFWLDPLLYINLNRQEEVVNLNRIVDKMETMRNKL